MADTPRPPFRVPVAGGELVEYMVEVAAELGEEFHVAMHQQRGVPPSILEGPFEIARTEALRLVAELPALEGAPPGIRPPFGCVAGALSPMPWDSAGQATVRAIPGAWIDVIEEAGHLPWFERPGCVAATMRRLVSASDAP